MIEKSSNLVTLPTFTFAFEYRDNILDSITFESMSVVKRTDQVLPVLWTVRWDERSVLFV